MKKVNVKKLLTLALAICLTFTPAYAFAPNSAIKAHAVGDLSNPTPIQPTSNTDFSSGWTSIQRRYTQCYKVTLPTDGIFSVTLMAKNSENISFLVSASPSMSNTTELIGTHIGNFEEDSPTSGTISTVLSAGTYYIPVRHNMGHNIAQYQIKTVFESFGFADTPDSYDSPKALSIGTTYTNAITKTDKEDWYKVTIPENGKFNFTCQADRDRVVFELKDINLKGITTNTCLPNTPISTADAFIEAGTYYFHVHGYPSKYSFTIKSASVDQTSITKVKAVKKKKVNVTFKNVTGVTGFQIRYSTDKNFNRNVKTKTIPYSKARFANANKRYCTISKLKKNKKYYFQIRTYVEKNNSTYYSYWSKSKSVKVK